MFDECEKWGVLFKKIVMKIKNWLVIDDFDWILNFIYVFKFEISYWKCRKFILFNLDICIFFDLDKEKYNNLFNDYKKVVVEIKKKVVKLMFKK